MEQITLTRPAKPGDTLWASLGDGWLAEVVLADPPDHPPSGAADIPVIRVRATLWLETTGPDEAMLRRDLRDFGPGSTPVMGYELSQCWGRYYKRPPDGGTGRDYRAVSQDYEGSAIAPLVAEAVADLQQATRIVDSVRDAHAASVARLAAARETAYAAWQVPDVEGTC